MMFMEGTHVRKGSTIRVCGYSANGGDFQIRILMFPFILVLLLKKIMLTVFAILLIQCSWKYKHNPTHPIVIKAISALIKLGMAQMLRI